MQWKVLIVPIHENGKSSFLYEFTEIGLACPRPVHHLLRSAFHIKFGVNIVGDVTKLQKYMNIDCQSCVDLSSLAKTVDKNDWYNYDKSAHFHTGLSLSIMSQAYLRQSVYKPDSPSDLNPLGSGEILTQWLLFF